MFSYKRSVTPVRGLGKRLEQKAYAPEFLYACWHEAISFCKNSRPPARMISDIFENEKKGETKQGKVPMRDSSPVP